MKWRAYIRGGVRRSKVDEKGNGTDGVRNEMDNKANIVIG